MAENKTQPNNADVTAFINTVSDAAKRADCMKLVEIMRQITGEQPKMWGGSIVGFSEFHYQYASGREGDWFKLGFSPRKQNITLYLSQDFPEKEEILSRLGKHKTGVGCVYVKTLQDVDESALQELLATAVKKRG